jgi:hypothetical protein
LTLNQYRVLTVEGPVVTRRLGYRMPIHQPPDRRSLGEEDMDSSRWLPRFLPVRYPTLS